MPKIGLKTALLALIATAFLLLVVLSVIVTTASAWFLIILVAFTALVIGAGPWVLGS